MRRLEDRPHRPIMRVIHFTRTAHEGYELHAYLKSDPDTPELSMVVDTFLDSEKDRMIKLSNNIYDLWESDGWKFIIAHAGNNRDAKIAEWFEEINDLVEESKQ